MTDAEKVKICKEALEKITGGTRPRYEPRTDGGNGYFENGQEQMPREDLIKIAKNALEATK